MMNASPTSGDMQPLIRLSKSSIGSEEKAAVADVLDREYLGMGDEVKEFEKLLANIFNRPVVCVNSGTAALHLAIQALGLGHGDEVLVPSLTYVASFQAVSATGAIPIPCDIDPETLVIDPVDAASRMTDKTRAIMPVHYSGSVGDLDGIYDFADFANLRVIEDAAHSFGTEYKGRKVGTFGDISCFSFDGIKNITSGEGGCIVTGDMKIIGRSQDARLLGVEKDSEKRFSGQRSWEFDVLAQGWRFHMSNIMAAIGIAQLKKFQEMAIKRQELARYYDKLLERNSKIRKFKKDYSNVVPHLYVIQLQDGINRSRIREELLTRGVQTGIHYQPNHQLTYFARKNSFPLKITEEIAPQLLSLPLHIDLEFREIEYITDHLAAITD